LYFLVLVLLYLLINNIRLTINYTRAMYVLKVLIITIVILLSINNIAVDIAVVQHVAVVLRRRIDDVILPSLD